jgi:ATP-binding cassette subfamily C (CFTR/MRP) protein 1
MYNPLHPPPAPPAFGSHTVVPERKASIFSKLIFHWLSPLLSVGFTRPLEVDDLWQLDEHNKAKKASQLLETHFYRGYDVKTSSDEQKEAPATDATPGEKEESDSGNDDLEKGTQKSKKVKAVKGKKKKQPSLVLSIHAVFWRRIWLGGFFKLISDTLQTTSPLVNKALLNWLTVAFLFTNTTGAGQADSENSSISQARGSPH